MSKNGTIDDLFTKFDAELKPDAPLKNVRKEMNALLLGKDGEGLREFYDGKPVEPSKVESAYNDFAKGFITRLYGAVGRAQPLVDDPTVYGNAFSNMLGQEAIPQFKEALKKGETDVVIALLGQVIKRHGDKRPSMLSHVGQLPSDDQDAFYTKLGKAGELKNKFKVVRDPMGASQVVANLYAARHAYN